MTDKELYRETFSRLHASPETRRNIMRNSTQGRPRRLLPALLTAALLITALSVTALAAFSSPIQDWFREQWNGFTGQELSGDQLNLIDSLTQPVNESVTVDGVTVTVDSITVGGDILWALVKVSGMEFSPRETYTFDGLNMEITPELSDGSIPGGVYGHGGEFLGLDQDGAANFLLEYSVIFPGNVQLSDGDYSLLITTSDLALDPPGLDNNEVIREGDWSFTIPLTVESLSPEKEVANAQVTLEGTRFNLTNITVTVTGVRFSGDRILDPMTVSAVLTDGTVVESAGGGGVFDEDFGSVCSLRWPVPLDVEDIAALRIGDTELPLS